MAGLRLGARTRMSGKLPCGGASPPTAPRQLHGPSRAACRALTREDGQPPEWPAICPGSGARAAAAWTARARAGSPGVVPPWPTLEMASNLNLEDSYCTCSAKGPLVRATHQDLTEVDFQSGLYTW